MSWTDNAPCRDMDPDDFETVDASTPLTYASLATCEQCNVRETCLEFALDHRERQASPKTTAAVLDWYASWPGPVAASQAILADQIGVTRRTVGVALKQLTEAGSLVIVAESRGRSGRTYGVAE